MNNNFNNNMNNVFNNNMNNFMPVQSSFNNQLFPQFQNMNNMNANQNQIQNNNIINPKIISLKHIFPWPPRVGLNNIGATCYMNSTLQCFWQIEEFAIYFKYDKHVNEIKDNYINNKKYLTPSFKLLIEEIWPDDEK